MSDPYERMLMSRGARVAVPVVAAVLLITGLAATPWIGIPALLVLVAFVGWMAYRSPDPTSGLARLRLLVVGILVAVAVGRFLTAVLG
ncbi:hypothetical protein H4N58_13085 [Mumia sp. ZJ1417]|uniref:hypothetical protein n=1 Tax=Mumia sp. ZJ1417 TaxID=2708082 RepID=UPI001422C761|nr:hypothetical protein [Mumia sp. ZJ1417]QMW65145.1 hypothetical protein H4N58_13085 [Mumia sp. ZJ1417]